MRSVLQRPSSSDEGTLSLFLSLSLTLSLFKSNYEFSSGCRSTDYDCNFVSFASFRVAARRLLPLCYDLGQKLSDWSLCVCVCVCVQDHPGYSVLITETGSSVVFDLEGCFESRVKSGNVISLGISTC